MTLAQVDIGEVWRALGGGGLQHGRGRAFWRNGDGWSIALNREKGVYYDHRDGQGGGVLGLTMKVLGADQHAALAWLEAHVGLDGRQQPSGREQQRREHAAIEADRIQQWHAGYLSALEQAKVTALDRFLANPEDGMFACFYESACIVLRNTKRLHGSALIDAFRSVMKKNPAYAEELISAARADQAHAEFCTAMAVAVIAKKEASL